MEWVKTRKVKKGAQDWYFMAYGNDYKTALKDFTTLQAKFPFLQDMHSDIGGQGGGHIPNMSSNS